MNKYNSAQSEVVDVTPCWGDLITSLLHLGFDGYVWVQQLQRLVAAAQEAGVQVPESCTHLATHSASELWLGALQDRNNGVPRLSSNCYLILRAYGRAADRSRA